MQAAPRVSSRLASKQRVSCMEGCQTTSALSLQQQMPSLRSSQMSRSRLLARLHQQISLSWLTNAILLQAENAPGLPGRLGLSR